MAPGLGASALGGLGSLTPYRPYFLGLAVLMLSWTFYRHYKNRVSHAWGNGLGAVLAALRPATAKDVRLLLGVGLVAVLMTFPQWGRPFFPKTANPCAAVGNPCASKNPCRTK
ncbi:MAG: hypothetical protein O7G88_12715 [bacterium]|nr:hypothetical protein [bacterium]